MFLNAALSSLKAQHHIPDEVSNVNDYRVRHAIETWGGLAKLDAYDSGELAVEEFTAWLDTYAGIPPVNHTLWNGYVEVSLSMPTKQEGALTITLGDTLDLDAAQDDVNERVHALADMLRTGYIELVNRRGAFGVPSSQSKSRGGVGAAAAGAIPISSLVVNVENGKTGYKLKGGEYSEYGVRVWGEVLTQAGIDPEKLKLGENPMKGYFWCQYKEDGKPKKVINIELQA